MEPRGRSVGDSVHHAHCGRAGKFGREQLGGDSQTPASATHTLSTEVQYFFILLELVRSYGYSLKATCICVVCCRVLKRTPRLKRAVEDVIASFKSISNVFVVSCVFFTFYGILGVQVRGYEHTLTDQKV